MKYDYQISPHKKHRFLKRLSVLILAIFILAGLMAGLFLFDSYLQDRNNTPDKTTTRQTTAFYDIKEQIYQTRYFQFQTKGSWKAIPGESSGSKYLYRNLSDSLIEEELVVYVNNLPSNLAGTRVLPVSLAPAKNNFEADMVSEHCIKALGGLSSSADKEVSLEGVNMLCDSDSTMYEVLVGLKGGGTKLTLNRPDNTQAAYSIFYRNVKATPSPEQLYQIITSFQAR